MPDKECLETSVMDCAQIRMDDLYIDRLDRFVDGIVDADHTIHGCDIASDTACNC